MEWLRQFYQRYAVVGALMTISAGAYLLMVLLLVILGPGAEGFEAVFRKLTIPVDLEAAIRQPWAMFTFWVYHPYAFWMVLVDLALIFSFGMVLQGLVGRERLVWLSLVFLAVDGLFTLALCNLLPTIEANGQPIFGMHGVSAALVAAATTLAPRLRIRLFSWEVDLMWIGIVALLLPLVTYRAIFTVMGTSVLVGAMAGAVTGFLLRRGVMQWGWISPKDKAYDRRVHVRETRPNPQYKGKFIVVRGPSGQDPEEELNRLLDRINEVGFDRLTPSEKKRLEELSGR